MFGWQPAKGPVKKPAPPKGPSAGTLPPRPPPPKSQRYTYTGPITNVSTISGPSSGTVYQGVSSSFIPGQVTWPDAIPQVEVQIIERSGPYEIILVGGIKFLRREDTLAQTAEYKPLAFQVLSIKQVLSKLEIKPVDGEDSEWRALLELERCIVHKAENGGLGGNDAEAAWSKYLKLKELALKPGTPSEGIAAMKAAIKKAIDLAL